MKKTEWRGRECPPLYEVQRNGGMLQLTLYADPRQVNEEDREQSGQIDTNQWVADALTLPIGVLDYGSIASAYINNRYTFDSMQAIINNHLLGDEDHESEYKTMQEYRKKAKEWAKEIVSNFNIETEE